MQLTVEGDPRPLPPAGPPPLRVSTGVTTGPQVDRPVSREDPQQMARSTPRPHTPIATETLGVLPDSTTPERPPPTAATVHPQPGLFDEEELAALASVLRDGPQPVLSLSDGECDTLLTRRGVRPPLPHQWRWW